MPDRREYYRQWAAANRPRKAQHWDRCLFCGAPIQTTGQRKYCNHNHALKASRARRKEVEK